MAAHDPERSASGSYNIVESSVIRDLRDGARAGLDGLPTSRRGAAFSDFGDILDALSDPVVVLDLDGLIVWANRRFLWLVETPLASAASRPIESFISRDDDQPAQSCSQAVERFIAQAVLNAEPHVDYSFHLTGGGTDLPIYFTGTPIKDRAGKVTGIVALGRDYGPWRELQKQYEEANALAGEYAKRLDARSGNRLAEVKQRARMLEELSITDELTKLYNRRFFFKRVKEEIGRSNRYGTPFSVVLLDIDHFKLINDTFGHVAGDMVLYELAGLLRGSVRNVDVVARTGGEEFFILLPSIREDHALIFCERLREKVAAYPFTYLPDDRRVTISLGITDYPRQGITDIDALVQLADSALYRAKTTRNASFASNKL